MGKDELEARRAKADARHSRATAHIGYALTFALLDELEKESPGLRKRVWESAQRSLLEYDVLDQDSADWLAAKVRDV